MINYDELKSFADQIRVIKDAPTLTMEGRDALKRIADKLNPPKEYPPYGVPIEVLNGSGEWLTRVSAGDGYHYDGNGDICTLSAWPKWRYKPVDWDRAPEKYKVRLIDSNGCIDWTANFWDGIMAIGNHWRSDGKILHIDRRPQ